MATTRVISYVEMFLFLCSGIILRCSTTHIKGVAISKLSYYNPGKDFTCFDGHRSIPFSSVNDDYCDCPDGSDEPGTAACPNAQFTCRNEGFKEISIPSNRVNDEVCDCCDGSDEYNSDITCPNTCDEIGRAERERLAREREAQEQGYLIKLEYIKEGKEKKIEREAKFEELKTLLEEQKAKFEELKAAKERAEAPEKEAKEKHDKVWEEVKEARKKERQKQTAEEAFKKLDADQNGVISINELMSTPYFEKDLTEEAVKGYLNGVEELDLAKLTEMWGTFEGMYKPNGRDVPEEKPEEAVPPPPPAEEEPSTTEPYTKPSEFPDPGDVPGVDDNEDDVDDDDEDSERDRSPEEPKPEPTEPSTSETKDEEKMPEYDEETKRLIAVADQIRKEHDEAEKHMKDTEKEHGDIDKILNLDLGKDQEFQFLLGNCYEFTDREYTYKLCPFEKAVQMPKSGGSETSLGTWHGWEGSTNIHSVMKYSGGEGCWNGPSRSAEVHLSCGTTNELFSVSEPNRCEYLMKFKTPALCNHPANTHDEL